MPSAPSLPLPPATYADVLTLAQSAQIVSYYRRTGDAAPSAVVMLTLDDYAADRRTVLEVYMGRGRAGVAQFKTLSGYDPRKHRWGEYCAPAGEVALPDRKGQKALLAWLAERSQALTGWPAAPQWTDFRPAPVPAASAVMTRALAY
jgi:hypothetical protein